MNSKQIYKLSEPYNYNNDKEYSLNDPISFFDEIAKKYVKWDKMYDQVYSGNELKPNWYNGGKLNVCYNILDVNALNNETKDKIALIHECPMFDICNKITYFELWNQVCIFSRALKNIGIIKGDKVMIVMPNGIITAIAMLSCLRLGAIHYVSSATVPNEISNKIEYFKPKLLITQNCGIHSISSELYNHSSIVLDALKLSTFKIDNIIVNNRNDISFDYTKKQFFQNNIENSMEWNELIYGLEPLIEYEIVNSNDSIFISFTSGTTGNSKGIIFKSGEFAVMNSYIFNMFDTKSGDVIFPAPDMGSKYHHNLLYASLKVGSTLLLMEGNRTLPKPSIMFELCSKYNVKTMMIIPRKIKEIFSNDKNYHTISNLNLSCLKNIILVGEKYDESVVFHLKKSIGNNVIVSDDYGQTETHSIACSQSLQFPIKLKSAGKITPGYNVEFLSKTGKKLNENEKGELVIKLPLPPGCVSLIGIDEYDELTKEKYFSKYPGYFNGGDAGYFDNDNYNFILSRVDDIAIIDGHDIYVGECDDIINSTNSMILDSVVVGVNDSNCTNSNQRLVGFILFKPEFQQLISTYPNNSLNSIHNDINNKLVEKFGGEYARLKHIIPITIIPISFNNKKIKYIFSKLYNGEPCHCPKSINNVNSFYQLEFEINQFKKQNLF